MREINLKKKKKGEEKKYSEIKIFQKVSSQV
jgi:hypothetical protein